MASTIEMEEKPSGSGNYEAKVKAEMPVGYLVAGGIALAGAVGLGMYLWGRSKNGAPGDGGSAGGDSGGGGGSNGGGGVSVQSYGL